MFRAWFQFAGSSILAVTSLSVRIKLKTTFICTSSNCSFVSIIFLHHSNLFCLFSSRISWQLLGAVTNQPNCRLALSTVLIDMDRNIFWPTRLEVVYLSARHSLTGPCQCHGSGRLEVSSVQQLEAYPPELVHLYLATRRCRLLTDTLMSTSFNLSCIFL